MLKLLISRNGWKILLEDIENKRLVHQFQSKKTLKNDAEDWLKTGPFGTI